MSNKLLQQQLKNIIRSLNNQELETIFLNFEKISGMNLQKICRIVSYKCYEACILFSNKKANGFGRNEQEATINCIKNLFELLTDDEKNFPVVMKSLKNDQSGVRSSGDCRKEQINSTLPLNISSQINGEMSFELKGDIEILSKNIGNISIINNSRLIEFQSASQAEIDDVVLRSLLENSEKAKCFKERNGLNPLLLEAYDKIQQKIRTPTIGKIHKQWKTNLEMLNDDSKRKEVETKSNLERNLTEKNISRRNSYQKQKESLTSKHFRLNECVEVENTENGTCYSHRCGHSKDFVAVSPLREKSVPMQGNFSSRKNSKSKQKLTDELEENRNLGNVDLSQQFHDKGFFMSQHIKQNYEDRTNFSQSINHRHKSGHTISSNCDELAKYKEEYNARCYCGAAENLAKAQLMIERLEKKLKLVLEENKVLKYFLSESKERDLKTKNLSSSLSSFQTISDEAKLHNKHLSSQLFIKTEGEVSNHELKKESLALNIDHLEKTRSHSFDIFAKGKEIENYIITDSPIRTREKLSPKKDIKKIIPKLRLELMPNYHLKGSHKILKNQIFLNPNC